MRARRILPACLGLCLVASCSLRQPAVSTVDYAFAFPVAARGPAGAKSIAVAPFTAEPKSAGQMLLYRVTETRYEHDFYNRLLAPPPQLLTGALRRHLSQARVGQVREPGTPLGSDLLVQPRLVELYADYRDESRLPMKAVSPAAAVDAWSEGLGQIFQEFTADLRRAAG
jgi:hypothetical protein